ncbi:ribonuclease domain-containing protein [Spirillospora sp. NPDC047279]|uniref:ribonuclease domain-containing protein n=1 Tax=Spirillospora sp. NPDC047279 TaxID=3155478 RepID=UPI003402CC62
MTCLLIPLMLALLGLGACTRGGDTSGGGTSGRTSAAGTGASSPTAGGRATTIPDVRESDLPAEARRILRLIDQGGPFPYRKDGSVFGNRERLLPREARGYYREYTVPTPGSQDRGARRLIAGKNGERYYTADHYRSFVRVAGP